MDIDMQALRAIERDKGISLEVLIRALEEALRNAYEKTPQAKAGARVALDRKTGRVSVLAPERDEEGNVVGEFEDSALMSVFAARGLGVFPVSRLGADDLGLMPGLLLLGCCEGVNEDIYAIRNRRSQHHPLVQKLAREAPRSQ